MRSAEDFTTVARIRDAAIDQFGQHGFSASVRSIAAAAGIPQRRQHLAGSSKDIRRPTRPRPHLVLRVVAPRPAEVLHDVVPPRQEVQGDEDLREEADLSEVGEPPTIQLGRGPTSPLQHCSITHG